jgi:hypothetical protein
MSKDFLDFIPGRASQTVSLLDERRRVQGVDYVRTFTIGGEVVDVPIRDRRVEPKYACELFWTNKCYQTFGVRYTDGSEKIVEDTERNRTLYTAMIEYYRDKMDNLMDRRE